jgi:hypothetical protein
MSAYLLRAMLHRSPLLLVMLVGIVFALVRWKRHPKISFCTTLGLVIYLFKHIVITELSYSIPGVMKSWNLSYAAANNMYTALGVVSDLVFAAVVIILVIAAFAQRAPATNQAPRVPYVDQTH